MNPTTKAPAIENLLEGLFGRTASIQSDVCVFCKQPATEFRDKLSEKEYRISGICQVFKIKRLEYKTYV